MVDRPSLRLAIGSVLRRYRENLGISQAAFAEKLGISQPYLSRLEREQRSAVSLALWNKISMVVDRPELYIVDEAADDLDELYERALVAYGSGNQDTAEALLETIARTSDHGSIATDDLVAKSKFWLAGIRRDRNELDGEFGAEALYRQVLTAYRGRYSQRRVLEVKFVMAACREMAEDHMSALSMYRNILHELEGSDLSRLRTRVNGRIGALTTKLREYDIATQHLDVATSLAVHLDDAGPYSYYHEKRAILQTRLGNLDDAYDSLLSARTEIGEADYLRQVQSYCVEANILYSQGQVSAALKVLETARRLAERHNYRHQLTYIGTIISLFEVDQEKWWRHLEWR